MDETLSLSRSRSSRSRKRDDDPAPTGLFVRGTDAGLAATIFLLPYVMGGRQAWGHLLVALLACWTALCWALQQILSDRPRWRLSGAEPLFCIGLTLLILQVVSLPPATVKAISPTIEKRLPMWNGDSEFGPWTTISLTPHDTLANTITVGACILLFVIAVQRCQKLEDVDRLLTWIGLSAAAMSAFGSIQLLLGNGKFFWFYDHPYTNTFRIAKGGFTNANHFAHFVALGVPIWLWKLATTDRTSKSRSQSGEWRSGVSGEVQRLKSMLAAICLGVIGTGLLLSQSRGGLAAAAVGAAVTLFFLWRQSLIGPGLAFAISGLAVASAVSLAFFGDDVEALVQKSLSEMTTTDVEKIDQGEARRRIWLSAIAAAKDYPIAGTGLGSHVEVYPTYYDSPSDGVEYTHAENGYLQILMETGVAGLGIAILFILVVSFWCLRGMARSASRSTSAPLAACTAVVAMNVVHSITDFIWYVPALMAVVLLIAATAVRMYQLAGPAIAPSVPGVNIFSRASWSVAAVAMLGFASFTIQFEWPAVACEPHWFNYIHLTRAITLDDRLNAEEGRTDGPDMGLIRRRLAAIAAAVRANPKSHRAQMALAKSYVQFVELKQLQSENAMPLSHLRDAAKTNFDSLDQMLEWLEKPALLGERRKMLSASLAATRRALHLCPLISRGYLNLSELGWLEGVTDDDEQLLVDQAFDVRPFDPRVHFLIGRREFVNENFDVAMEHWREAFSRDPDYRRQLIQGLADFLPPAFFLKEFELDLDSLHTLWASYERRPEVPGREKVLERLAKAEVAEAQKKVGTEAVRHWLMACNCYAVLQDHDAAVDTAMAAVDANRTSIPARLRLGNLLFEEGDYDGAAQHLTWCVVRSPDDADLRARAERAIMLQGKARTRIAKEPGDRSTTR